MARNTKTVVIETAGRDKGKTFVITEFPAVVAEKWAMRAFLALAQSGMSIPDEIAKAGMAGVAALGLRGLSGITWAQAEPLLDQLMECVKFLPDPSKADTARTPLESAGDIEEITTLLMLRKEVFQLHTSFLQPVK